MEVSKFIVLFIAALVQSSYSAPPPSECFCTREYRPVCGSDDQTYNNNCLFQCEKTRNKNLQIKSYGECFDRVESSDPEICACPFNFSPVCGSDHQTYANLCTLNCAKNTNKNLVGEYQGVCHEVSILPESAEAICACPFNFSPICGSDGKTYANPCTLNCAKNTNKNLVAEYQGVCHEVSILPEPFEDENADAEICACTRLYAPVCGSDHQTYANLCTLNCAKNTNKNLVAEYQGQCHEVSILPESAEAFCTCPFNFSPICGSDGKTYANLCTLNCAKNTNKNLVAEYQGQCHEVSILPERFEDVCICTQEYSPVCGSDDQTYSNKCSLNCEKRKKTDLSIKHVGKCVEKVQYGIENADAEICACTRLYAPVCGSDHQTYGNTCTLNCAKRTNKNLVAEYQGVCHEVSILPESAEAICACPFNFSPICGSDGKTYANLCSLNCAKNTNKNLVAEYQGECHEVSILPEPFEDVCICTREYAPVCGSDDLDYANACTLNCAKNTNKNLIVKHQGKC